MSLLDMEIQKLEELRSWMRTHGIVRAKVGSFELELGPAPTEAEPPPAALTDEQLVAEFEAALEEREKILFGASAGLPIEMK